MGVLNFEQEVTRPGVNLRGRLGHVAGIGTGAQLVDPNGRRQGGGLELEAPLGAVALDLPEVTTGDQGLLGRTGDLEVPTGGRGEVLSEGPVLHEDPVPYEDPVLEDPGLGVPGDGMKVQRHRGQEEVSGRGWVRDRRLGSKIVSEGRARDCANTTDSAVIQIARLNTRNLRNE